MFIGLLIFLAATSTTTGTVPLTIPTSGDTTAPSTPILISPPNNSQTANPQPEFVWHQSTDPNGNNVIYNLYFFNTATYRDISSLGNSSSPNYTTRLEGDTIHLTPTYALPDGRYTWYVTASDLSGNTSRSETWNFLIATAYPTLPATISNLRSTIYDLRSLVYGLLALTIIILLIFLWRRRYNLILLDPQLHPIKDATIYHSLPPLKSGIYRLTSSDHGRVFIPHLSRYSTLTIRIQGQDVCTTYILSISVKQRIYTIILG